MRNHLSQDQIPKNLEYMYQYFHQKKSWQVVDGGVNNHTVRIDQVQATQCLAFVIEDVESVADLLVEVSDQGIVDVAQTALIAGSLNPGQMAELAVNGNAEDFGVLAGEICVAVAEGRDFCGADEGEIQGIEEEHHVLAAVLGQGDFLEFLVHHCSGSEIGGLLAHTKATGLGHVRGAVRWNLSAERLKRSRYDYKFRMSIYHERTSVKP